MTIPPSTAIARCRSTRMARTLGRRATDAATRSISGVLIALVTSVPSMLTVVPVMSMSAPSASCATSSSRSSGTPLCNAFQPTARYIAPLSTWR
jgi:hypothetical protein